MTTMAMDNRLALFDGQTRYTLEIFCAGAGGTGAAQAWSGRCGF